MCVIYLTHSSFNRRVIYETQIRGERWKCREDTEAAREAARWEACRDVSGYAQGAQGKDVQSNLERESVTTSDD